MAVVDTTGSQLSLYVGISKAARTEMNMNGNILPGMVMVPTAKRAWIPLHDNPEAALHRAKWGAPWRPWGKGSVSRVQIYSSG